jgi:dCMP deaminase
MAKQIDLDKAYMKAAFAVAELSYARRKKVGAVIVDGTGIIAEGVNGTPSGMDNNCEDEKVLKHSLVMADAYGARCLRCDKKWTSQGLILNYGTVKYGFEQVGQQICETELTTRNTVIHAELNAIYKIARRTNSSEGTTLYCTLAPCKACAIAIKQAGIKRVVYAEQYPYRNHNGPIRPVGLEFLLDAGIEVFHLPQEE